MDSDFVDFGTYSPSEARHLLDAFVMHGIRFDLAVANKLPPPSRYGRFGVDAGVSVAIHRDDAEAAARLRADVFKVQV